MYHFVIRAGNRKKNEIKGAGLGRVESLEGAHVTGILGSTKCYTVVPKV